MRVDAGTWVAALPLSLPTLPDDLLASSAGCVVVGLHLAPDGTTLKPRVMQGAFTKDVPPDSQKAFIAQALDASARWRFRYQPPTNVPAAVKRDVDAMAAPKWAFHREVIGFASSSPDGAPSAVVSAEKQDTRVAGQCQLEALAEWGKHNAIAVEAAKARTGDPVLVTRHAGDFRYWTASGDQAAPRFPVKAVRNGMDACVILGFMIGVDGVPSEFRIMSIRTVAPPPISKEFEDAALGAAVTWRYEPGPDNLKRLPEFRQTPVKFDSDAGRTRIKCEVVDLSMPPSPSSPGA